MSGERIYNEVVRAGTVAEGVERLSRAELLAVWEHAMEVCEGGGVPAVVLGECMASAARRWKDGEFEKKEEFRG